MFCYFPFEMNNLAQLLLPKMFAHLTDTAETQFRSFRAVTFVRNFEWDAEGNSGDFTALMTQIGLNNKFLAFGQQVEIGASSAV